MIKKIGILGCGTMGTGIAQVAALAGHEVLLFDASSEASHKSQQQLELYINKWASKGTITAEQSVAALGRLYFLDSLSGLSECDLVIEAIIEDLAVKQQVFTELESLIKQSCIVASNTSSFSITSLAASFRHPDRVVGLHFFNPAPLMKLVEVVPALQTDRSLLDPLIGLMTAWEKQPVLAQDTPGFIVNRIARPFYSEAIRIVEEGLATVADVDAAMRKLGFRMGPFELMDLIGNDINFAVTSQMYEAFYHEPRYKPSFMQKRLVDAGYLGRKSGKGYYDYTSGKQKSPTTTKKKLKKIGFRILVMLINEAADANFHQIATDKDIDLAMVNGVNYPKGLLAWSDDIGKKEVIRTLDRLYKYYHDPRYRVSPGLRYKKSFF